MFRSKLQEKIIQNIIYESISDGESYNEDFDQAQSKKEVKNIETETSPIKLETEPLDHINTVQK